MTPDASVIGVISDTHGLLRPEALAHLEGCGHIIHSGDVGDPAILERLREVAPLTVVRGNVDHGPWARDLPQTAVVEWNGVSIYVLHILDELNLDLRKAGFAVVVYGHTHKPHAEERGGILFLNPGSAGPKRFSSPISLAHLIVEQGKPSCQLVTI